MTASAWETVLTDFVASLDSEGPLVFILGAGCSISSGGPTTIDAFRELDSALQRFKSQERAFNPDQSPHEKRKLLRRSFERFSPGLGYRLLASIARKRQVYVVNFNWDRGVEEAAKALGIPYEGFEPGNAKWGFVQFPRKQPGGIRVVHVHGSLNGNPLARSTETSNFPSGLLDVLNKLWKFPKVCLGVDLGYELDFHNFLVSRTKRRGDQSPKPWYFSRGASVDGHLDKLKRIDALSRVSVTAFFDFDMFMVALAGHLKGLAYADFAKTLQELPNSLNDLCLPSNETLIPLVNAKTLCLASEPHAGGTTLAMLVAYLRFLLTDSANRPELVDGIAAIKARLGNVAGSVTGADGAATILVVDEVVQGAEEYDVQVTEVCRLLQHQGFDSTCVVLPLATVARLRSADAARSLEVFELVVDVRDDEPYSRSVLKSFAARQGRSDAFLKAVDAGLVRSAANVRDNRVVPMPALNQPGVHAELSADDTLKQLALCARLLELSARDKTVAELERLAKTSLSKVRRAAALPRYITTYEFERKDWFQVANGRRALLDGMLGAEADELRLELHGHDIALLYELEQWLLFLAVAEGRSTYEVCEPEYFRRMTSSLLEDQWSLESLQALLDHKYMDSWGATNLAYALLAGWERFDASKRREALMNLLSRRDLRGCYAVVEAALFLGTATPTQAWPALLNSCWKLFEENLESPELSLVVDAFMWRPPPAEQSGWHEFIAAYFGSMDRKKPHGGTLRFLAAYHASGLTQLYPSWEAVDDALDWNEGQSERAAWLVEWHFIHQTFARTIGFRFGRNDKDLLCRELHQKREPQVDKAQRRLLNSMLRHRTTAGWGFHAACLMGGKHEWLTETPDGRKLMLSLLTESEPTDLGVATGYAGFQAPRRVREIGEELVKVPERLATLERVVEKGARLDGRHFSQEQFKFVHDVKELWRSLRLKTPNVERQGLHNQASFDQFLREVEAGVDTVRRNGDEADRALMRRIAQVAEGLRMGTRVPSLEQAIPARDRTVSLGQHVLEVMLQMDTDSSGDADPHQLALL